jgi:cytochrome c2
VIRTVVRFALIGALVVFCGLVPGVDSSVDHGKEVYAAQKCALCHSISGIGGKKMSLDGVGSKLKPEEIKKWIRTPKEMKPDAKMKPYPNLPDRDLNDLTAFLTTLR